MISSDSTLSNLTVLQQSVFSNTNFESISTTTVYCDNIDKRSSALGVNVGNVYFLDGKSNIQYYTNNDRCIQTSTTANAITTGTYTGVILPTSSVDPLSGYSLVDGNYVISQNGFYFVSTTISWADPGTAAGMRNTQILHNGNVVSSLLHDAVVSSQTNQNVSTILNMVANDTVSVQAWHNHGSDVNISDADVQDNLSIVYMGQNAF